MRKGEYKKYIVIDTETAPIDKTIAEVSPWNMLVYNIGYAIVDRYGTVYKTANYLVNEIFFERKDLMRSAYFARKIPQYLEWLYYNEIQTASFFSIKKALLEDIRAYGITEVYAHNMRFDDCSLRNTEKYLTGNYCDNFFPDSVQVYDTLRMSRQIIAKRKSYIVFCNEYGYNDKSNNPRCTAEILYRYISNNNDFVESHTALEDVLIEKDILTFCIKQKKSMDRRTYIK